MQSRLLTRTALRALAAVVLAAGLTSAVQAVDFSGKRITLIVPTREGGGTDVYGRAIGPFLARFLPGNPTLVIRNIPGTGSVPGVNQFQREAPTDGSQILAVTTSTFANFMLGNPNVKYRLNEFIPIIVSPQGTFVYASPSTGAKGPGDVASLRGEELVYAGYGATSAEVRQLFMFHLLGLKVKPVFGLSRGKARQAFQRGETNINNDTAASFVKKVGPLIEKGKAVPLWVTGLLIKGEWQKDPLRPDLPIFTELYQQVHGKALSGPALEAWNTIASFSVMTNKAIMLPAGTPDDIVKAYRDAAAAMMKDPEFQEFRKKRLGVYPQAVGEDGVDPISVATNWSPEGRKYLADFLKTNYDVDF